ncbi:MAG: hypothetical protein JWM27_3653 [Gemmatimonadetes bacterium]|nr:hypothetical protein [Gemmatimonadota bacterium]
MRRSALPLLSSVAAALVLAAACKPSGGSEGPGSTAAADTAGGPGVSGMSSEQLKEQAKAVSPEEARQMGIPDSSVVAGSTNEVSDSLSSPAATPGPGAAGDSVGRAGVGGTTPPAPPARPDRPKP